MERQASGIDQSSNFFLTENGWDAMSLFGIGCLGDAPSLLERLDVEEPQGREAVRDCTRRQLAFLKQLGLIFANVPRTQAVWSAVESSSEIFDCVDVIAYGMFREVTSLEFFQHHFAKSGHGDYLLMTRQPISTVRQPPIHYLTRSVRREAASF